MNIKFVLNKVIQRGYVKKITDTVYMKRLTDTAVMPTHGSNEAAGYDLYADGLPDDGVLILPGENLLIGTGLSFKLPRGTFGGIYARSGWATKYGLRPANCVGIIDSDYRGEVKVALYNDSQESFIVKNGNRIAQLICQPYVEVKFVQREHLNSTNRGNGGFGSTGE